MDNYSDESQTISPLQAKLAKRAIEGLFVLTVALAGYFIIALLSYNSNDPAWSQVGNVDAVQNAAGVSGAWFADVLFSLIGYVAYLLPIALMYRAWLFFRLRDDISEFDWASFFIALIGMLLVILSLCGLAGINSLPEHSPLPFGNGGMLGNMLGESFFQSMGLLGGRLALFALLFIGITIFTDISWMAAIEWLGALVVVTIPQFLMAKFAQYQQKRADKKAQIVEIEQAPAILLPARAAPIEEELIIEENVDEEPAEKKPSFLSKMFTAKAEPVHEEKQEPILELDDFPELSAHRDDAAWEDWDFEEGDVEIDIPTLTAASERYVPPQAPIAAKTVAVERSAAALEPEPPQAPRESKPQNTVESAVAKPPVARANSIEPELPELSLLLKAPTSEKMGYSQETLDRLSRLLEEKLKDFKVDVTVTEVLPGPVVTRFEVQPAPGVKVSTISNLAKDIARSLAVMSVRVVEVIAGKTVIGIEIPNEDRQTVYFSEVVGSKAFEESESPLTLALGHDIAGEAVVADLAKMPHLLVAGTTGSGKSVGVNAMLLSMLFKATPEEVRLMLVDPKMLELSVYEGIPHLLTPVITDMKDASNGLRWCVGEMERRYKLLAKLGVRNIKGYNKKILDAREEGEVILDPLWKPEENFTAGYDSAPAPALDTLPYIVVVIDEFADMMMVVGKKVEELIARIAQKARAAGIHLILATQRPSVDVITGLIKANVPTRMAFQVSSKIDSRTILDQGGAEQLLGYGDMLYMPPGSSMLTRVHGAFVDDNEVHRVVASWKEKGEPNYIEGLLDEGGSSDIPGIPSDVEENGDAESDPLYDEAVACVLESRRASISSVQRKLRIGYNRSARLLEAMEAAGIVSAMGNNGQRDILVPESSSY